MTDRAMARDLERKTTRATLATRVTALAGGLLAAVIIGMLLMLGLQTQHLATHIAGTQRQNTETVRSTRQLARRIQSCTTPGRPCYDRGRRETANAVASINRVVVVAAACAAKQPPPSLAQVQACVLQRLSQHHHH